MHTHSKKCTQLPTMYDFVLLIVLFSPVCCSSYPDRYLKSLTSSSTPHHHKSQEYLELSHPLPSDQLTPSCSLLILNNHSFANTIGSPPTTVPYSPPSDCPSHASPWSRVVLDLSVACRGEQYDRIAGLWLGGAELLRTSTAEPTKSGIFWNVRKDITKYSSLLVRSDIHFTMMLENVVNDVFTGVYLVNVTFLFYNASAVSVTLNALSDHHHSHMLNRKLGIWKPPGRLNVYGKVPADLIIPISEDDGVHRGFWFRIESESNVHSKKIRIPPNSGRLVLELYISFHGNDEFWYSNPPNSYIKANNLSTGRGNGAYREVYVTVDGKFAASVVPFPVIFTGGINPLFWEPVVAIGAFNLPSYEVDLTPFLGNLLDDKSHSFTIAVADGISFWLVDANLHIWVDHQYMKVEAKSVQYQTPQFAKRLRSRFKELDGSFETEAKRKSQFVGWVKSNEGNLTTRILESFKFKNMIRFQRNGTYKSVEQRIKAKREVRIENEMGVVLDRMVIRRKYPLRITTSTQDSDKEKDTYTLFTNVTHALNEKTSGGNFANAVYNNQESSGWMMVKDHSVLAGQAETNQSFSYKDESSCYSRTVAANNGWLVSDNSTFSCAVSL